MPTFIALYRGINVGGNNAVKMDALRALHERLNHERVQNYIQSGNIVFAAKGSVATIAPKLAAAFTKEFGFTARILIVESARWADIVKNNPYQKQAAANPKTVHVAICEGPPSAAGLATLLAKHNGTEAFEIRNDILYLHAPDGLGTSKFAAGMEKAAAVPMTARNWRTVQALADLLTAMDATAPATP